MSITMIKPMLLLLFLSPDVGAQEAKIKVQCENRQQTRSLWQTCHMFIKTTGDYSNMTLKNELWKFVKSSDLSESCFDLHFFPYPQIRLQVDKELIEYSVINVLTTATSLVEINCSRTSYNVLDVVFQTSTKWCLLQPVPSNAICRIEDLELSISFSKDDPVTTYNKSETSHEKGEGQCPAEQTPGIKYKFSASLEQCEEIKKLQSAEKTGSFEVLRQNF